MRFLHRLGTVLAASLLYTAVSLATVLPASAEKRIALVVGNSAYRNVPPLTNPANDAKLIAETLRSLGFELVGGSAQFDLDKPGFEAIVKRFGTQMQGADVGLFYYAGHGVQVRGANYLVPVSANPEREADVDFEMLDTALVMRQMEGAGTRLNLIILDACRNNPFGGRALRGSDRGLAQMRAPEGTLISFATQPGNVAMDGEEGNSPYTKALAQTVKRPGLGIFDVFNEVGLEVKKQTGGSQQPWVSSSPITGSFYFSGPPVAQPGPPAMATMSGEQPDEAQRVWGTIQNTTSVAVLDRFIQRFPGSIYGDIARARLEELKKSIAPALTASRPAPHSPGAMSCAELNQPHDPQPVRQWLRDYLTSAGYDGDYQAAANGIGVLCEESPQWSVEMSARHWVEDLWGKRRAVAAAPPHKCSARVGYVTGLDPQGDNNLSVRDAPNSPKGLAHQIDELFTGDSVCIAGSDGTWFRVQYIRFGIAKTGWVHSHYIRLVGRGL